MSLSEIEAQVRAACAAAGRPREAVTLVAISKVQPEARVRAVLDAGHRVFGENRVQEAAGRWERLAPDYEGVRLHLVGPLQTNKLKRALDLFEAIHSLDRDSLALRLASAVQARGACPELFVQVNTGAEPQKAGVTAGELEAFLAACRTIYDLPVAGLMCIPPAAEDPDPHFALLAALAARHGIEGLSMGMSADFAAAIARGATHVRVGSALFGARSGAA